MKRSKLLLGLAALFSYSLLACASASADVVTYTGIDASKAALVNAPAARNAFLATLSSWGEDDLEGNDTSGGPVFAPNVFVSQGVTGTTTGIVNQFETFAVSGERFLFDYGPFTPDDPTVFDDIFTFDHLVTAFGAYIVQGGDGPKNDVTFRLENTLGPPTEDVVLTFGPGDPFFNVRFVGFTSTKPFNKITVIENLDLTGGGIASRDNDGLLFDDLLVGFLVPEPATFGMAAMAFVGLFVAHRRTRRSA